MNKNAKIVGRVAHEHAHLAFNEIINENKGTKFAFVCDTVERLENMQNINRQIK